MAESKASAKAGQEHEESGSFEETIEKAKGIDEGPAGGPSGVQSTTEVTPSEADESPAPGPYKGEGAPKLDDPPVRTTDPNVPIAQTLAAGAGEHTPPDPDKYDAEGRLRESSS